MGFFLRNPTLSGCLSALTLIKHFNFSDFVTKARVPLAKHYKLLQDPVVGRPRLNS
jgi:hypothetical protein